MHVSKKMALYYSFFAGTALAVLAIIGGYSPVFAQLDKGFQDAAEVAGDAKLANESREVTIIERALKTFLGFVGIVAVVVLIWGGFVFITSAGDENRAATGKQIIKYAIIGLLIIGLSAVIVNVTIDAFQGGSSSGGDEDAE